jgi:hypothetical protein
MCTVTYRYIYIMKEIVHNTIMLTLRSYASYIFLGCCMASTNIYEHMNMRLIHRTLSKYLLIGLQYCPTATMDSRQEYTRYSRVSLDCSPFADQAHKTLKDYSVWF